MGKEINSHLTLRKHRAREQGRIKASVRSKIFEYFRKLEHLEKVILDANKTVVHLFLDEIGFHGYNSLTTGCKVLVSNRNRQECYRNQSDEREHVTFITPVLMVMHPDAPPTFYCLQIAMVVPRVHNNTRYSWSAFAPRNAQKLTTAGVTLADFDGMFQVVPKWFEARWKQRESFADKFVFVASASGFYFFFIFLFFFFIYLFLLLSSALFSSLFCVQAT